MLWHYVLRLLGRCAAATQHAPLEKHLAIFKNSLILSSCFRFARNNISACSSSVVSWYSCADGSVPMLTSDHNHKTIRAFLRTCAMYRVNRTVQGTPTPHLTGLLIAYPDVVALFPAATTVMQYWHYRCTERVVGCGRIPAYQGHAWSVSLSLILHLIPRTFAGILSTVLLEL